jgi:predicted enzyme related to lactoylglutathione lyase
MQNKILVPKLAVPGMGYLAVCLDKKNNAFGILKTIESAIV